MKSVVITGVSSGIGYGLTKELLRRGYRVFGSVRTEADAERLKVELGERYIPLVFDVTDREAVVCASEEVGKTVGAEGLAGLVNNAGITIYGPLMHQPLEEVRLEFETNVIGLIAVTQAFLPLLGAKHPQTHPPGRIINIGSVNGEVATPFGAAYVGTKHAVEGISDSLRQELIPYGVDVTVVRPGPVKTKIEGKATEGRLAVYAETDYAEPLAKWFEVSERATAGGHSAEAFGRRVADVLGTQNPKPRYTFLHQKLIYWTLPTLLPERVWDWVMGRSVGLRRKKKGV